MTYRETDPTPRRLDELERNHAFLREGHNALVDTIASIKDRASTAETRSALARHALHTAAACMVIFVTLTSSATMIESCHRARDDEARHRREGCAAVCNSLGLSGDVLEAYTTRDCYCANPEGEIVVLHAGGHIEHFDAHSRNEP